MGCIFSFGANGVHHNPFFFVANHCTFLFFLFLVIFPLDVTSHIATLLTFLPSKVLHPTLVPYLLSLTNIATLITSYLINLATILTTYPTNLITLLITYPTNLTTVLVTYVLTCLST
jgi:hypothetical protein